ncbi:MAG: tripartite tricarboxylate transporter TctB family protein [Desulfobacterales bacterium]|nr:tripartite tricarboxylate transporter TctB family protein [Desulfobacterales bacterium]
MKNRGEFIFGCFILLIIAGFVALSLPYSPTARLVPLMVGIAGMIFIGLQLISSLPRFAAKFSFLNKKREFFSADLIKQKKTGLSEKKDDSEKDAARTVGALSVQEMFLWVLLFSGTIFLFGFLLSLSLLVGIFLKYRAMAGWRFSLLSAAGIAVVMHFGFEVLLNVFLYKGYLFILILGR